MHDRPPDEVLQLMLLHEADTIRPHDPVRAAQLDDAANELRTVMAEGAANDDGQASVA